MSKEDDAMMNRIIGLRDGDEPQGESKPKIRELGLEERRIIKAITGPQDKLDFPTHMVTMSNGKQVEVYDIPDEARKQVLDELYFFEPVPDLDTEIYDLHEQRMFTAREYMVIYEDNCNYLVSPFYPSTGGTLLDWMLPEDLAEHDDLMACHLVKKTTPGYRNPGPDQPKKI